MAPSTPTAAPQDGLVERLHAALAELQTALESQEARIAEETEMRRTFAEEWRKEKARAERAEAALAEAERSEKHTRAVLAVAERDYKQRLAAAQLDAKRLRKVAQWAKAWVKEKCYRWHSGDRLVTALDAAIDAARGKG